MWEMKSDHCVFAVAVITALSASPALAASGGEVLISQDQAISGSVTPGDAPGFPVTLSASGRYRLAGNLSPTAGTDGTWLPAGSSPPWITMVPAITSPRRRA